MFSKSNPIITNSTASIIPNNLSLITDSKRITRFAIISKNLVSLTFVDTNTGNIVLSQLINPKPDKDANPSDVSQLITILEAKFIKVADRIILVILTTKGIFFYEDFNLLYYHNIQIYGPSQTEDTTYARGFAFLPPNFVAIGTTSGTILIFDVPLKGQSVNLVNEINEKHIVSSICVLASDLDGNYLSACDTMGNIVVWGVKSAKNIKFAFTIRPKKIFCTSMLFWKNLLVCGFNNGLITIYDILNDGKRLIEIAAHARWINSLDINKNILVSSSEDCFLRVWELSDINGKTRINNVQNEKITDCFICSAQLNKYNNEICVTSYDNNEILVFKEN